MKNVHLALNFMPQRRKFSMAGLRWLGAALLLFGLAATVTGLQLAENAQRTRALATQNGSTKTVPVKVLQPARAPAGELARAALVRQTALELATPWADLLTSLEAAPANVALLSVEPSANKRSITLTAEAASPGEMLGYLQALQADKHLANVVLMSHQVQLQTPGKPLRFKLHANWGETP